MVKVLWTPSPEQIAATQIAAFFKAYMPLDSQLCYDSLWQWSVENRENFWRAIWDFTGVIGERGTEILRNANSVKSAQFFPEARLNYAENLLCASCSKAIDATAIIYYNETGQREHWTQGDLCAEVSRLQQALRDIGVGKSDKVAAYAGNTPQTLIAMLATTSLGAVWSSASLDFGTVGVLDRFKQIEPKILFCTDNYHYNGNVFSCLKTVSELIENLPTLEKIVVLPYGDKVNHISRLNKKAIDLQTFCTPYQVKKLNFTRVGFNDPLFILYSSGTTGLPKCIVHKVGGILLQHMKEHQLQCDISAESRLFYYTNTGWMMWNWMISALASQACLILYDGAAFFPSMARLVEIAECEKVTHLGVSAKYLDTCIKADFHPKDKYDLSFLRMLLSTGSPLSPAHFDAVYQNWKQDLCLASIAGGTDIVGCFVGASPINAVYRGQCQKRYLGMDVCVFDHSGGKVIEQTGELVCRRAHPSQPIGFLNDVTGQKYHKAYYDRFSGVWCHGDWVSLTAQGGMIFYGRSDAALNPGGVRIGTAEIYRQVEYFNEILEAVVIGQNWDNDVRVILFVRLRPKIILNADLIRRLKLTIKQRVSARHVPVKIIAILDIPRTHSGKIAELTVRDAVHGREVKNIESLANPQALELFRNLKALAD